MKCCLNIGHETLFWLFFFSLVLAITPGSQGVVEGLLGSMVSEAEEEEKEEGEAG